MQALTGKELDFISDSMANEELLTKQCVVAATHASTPAVRNLCMHLADRHMNHHHHLMSVLQQHAQLAPTQPQ